MLEHLEDHLPVEVLDLAVDDHRVQRNGTDWHGAVADDRFAARVQVATGREIHHGVGTPTLGPLQLLDLLVGSRRDGRGAHVGVDLGLGGTADGHRVELIAEVIDVGRDNHPPGGDLVADLLGTQVPLTLGHSFHLRGHGAQPSVLELSDRGEAFGRLPGLGRLVTRFGPRPQCPVVGHEVPGRLVGRQRHAGSVGGRERPGSGVTYGDPWGQGKAAGGRPVGGARGVLAQGRELIMAAGAGDGRVVGCRLVGLGRHAPDPPP